MGVGGFGWGRGCCATKKIHSPHRRDAMDYHRIRLGIDARRMREAGCESPVDASEERGERESNPRERESGG